MGMKTAQQPDRFRVVIGGYHIQKFGIGPPVELNYQCLR